MSACSDKELLLHGLLDGELDAVNALACEEHVSVCPGCQEELQRLRQLRVRLQAPEVRFTAPQHLRARVLAALAAESRTGSGVASSTGAQPIDLAVHRAGVTADRAALTANVVPTAASKVGLRRRWWAGGPLPVAASVLVASMLVAVGSILFALRAQPDAVQDQIIASHVRSLLVDHLIDIETSDRHVVKPWFNGKTDFAPAVFELADQGFPLVGGRLDYIGGKVVAAVVYHRRQHVINLFMWPAAGAPPEGIGQRDGFSVIHWTRAGLQLWAVSDLDPVQLREFRAAFDSTAAL